MSLNLLHHCSIRTTQLEKTRDFFVHVLGMEDGHRPPFDFPGNWLYIGKIPVVHLIGIDANNQKGIRGHLGGQNPADLQGSGAIDHIAFSISETKAIRQRIEAHGLAYREQEVSHMNLQQFFLEDPNGVTIELNYFKNS